MPVRGEAITVWHLQAHGIVTAWSSRVAFDYCKLCAGGHKWRRWTPRNCSRGECIFVMSTGMCSNRDNIACYVQCPHDREGDVPLFFHASLLRDCRWGMISRDGGFYNAATIAFRYLLYIVASCCFLLDNAGLRAAMARSKQGVGDVEVDLGRYELRRSGRRVRIEKKPMELLIFLLERREQMVAREEIVKRLWRSNLFIDSEKNINNIVRKLRAALGDNAGRPKFLETVVGKGYRFVGAVRVIDPKYPFSNTGQKAARTDFLRAESELSERSSIAVLPLLLLDETTDDQGLCIGFADALVSLLGKLSGVDVLPTSAVLDFPADLKPSEIASH